MAPAIYDETIVISSDDDLASENKSYVLHKKRRKLRDMKGTSSKRWLTAHGKKNGSCFSLVTSKMLPTLEMHPCRVSANFQLNSNFIQNCGSFDAKIESHKTEESFELDSLISFLKREKEDETSWECKRQSLATKNLIPLFSERDANGILSEKRKPLKIFSLKCDRSFYDDIDLPNLETDTESIMPDIYNPSVSTETQVNPNPVTFSTSVSNNSSLVSDSFVCKMENSDPVVETFFVKKARRVPTLYLEFPSFFQSPSSHSSLKHLRVNGKYSQAPTWRTVSELSSFKLALIEVYCDVLQSEQKLTFERKSRMQVDMNGELCNKVSHLSYVLCTLSSVFRSFASSKAEPPKSLIADLLKHLLDVSVTSDGYDLYASLKSAVCLNPLQNALPLLSDIALEVFHRLDDALSADGERQQDSMLLCLDFVISCLETEFLLHFQSLSLRRMRRSKIFEFLNADSTLKHIHQLFFVSCSQHKSNEDRLGFLLRRLLNVADAVLLAGNRGVEHVARALAQEYHSCEQLGSRVTLLESVAFPLHRFALARQVLEKWRGRFISLNLRSLLVDDPGKLLDMYFTGRFLLAFDREESRWMSAEKAEEFAMVLYTLVESYVSTVRDLLPSAFWAKVVINNDEKSLVEFDLSSLSLLPGYVKTLQTFLDHHLLVNEELSRRTHLFLLRLKCFADMSHLNSQR